MGNAVPPPAPDPDLVARLRRAGQQHVLQWWDELPDGDRGGLLQQVGRIDLDQIERLVAQHVQGDVAAPAYDDVEPAPVLRCGTTEGGEQAVRVGRQTLQEGRVAVLLVAGGQGTRLGFPQPKGQFPIGPLSGRSLQQIHAEKVVAVGRRYGTSIPYYIMTSPATDAPTREFFEANRFFGLRPEDVHIFQQGTMPAVDRDGRLILADKGRLFESPNGHGGLLQALDDHHLLDHMQSHGIQYLFYHQVDNPLVKVCDPEYIGRHILTGSEFSSKVVAKDGPLDRLGNPCRRADRYEMIEYSDLPEPLATATHPDGSLRFWTGSIAIHVISTAFFERLIASGQTLPFHRASKKIACVDASGRHVEPQEPNGVKFERFIFDAMPSARYCLVMETPRDKEYHPLKDDKGEYSPERVRAAMSRLYASWLERAGKPVPRGADGQPRVQIEISPLFALDADELAQKADRIPPVHGDLCLSNGGTQP